jgi:sorbitol/mannitol transport system permease protein
MKKPGDILLTLLTYLAVFAMFFPILWTLVAALKTEANAVSLPPTIAFVPTIDNFVNAFSNAGYLSFFAHSLVITIGSTAVAFVLGVPAAFALGMFPTKGTAGTLSWILSTKMMPAVGVIVPLIIIYKKIALFDTFAGMILLYAAVNLPLVIYMMRSFFAEIPPDLIEAARIDGAGIWRIMGTIALPLATPGLAATALLCVIFAWNEFFLVINLAGPHASTLPVYIAGFMTSEGLFWARMSAASTLAILPVLIAGWSAQRALVRGLTLGAVK